MLWTAWKHSSPPIFALAVMLCLIVVNGSARARTPTTPTSILDLRKLNQDGSLPAGTLAVREDPARVFSATDFAGDSFRAGFRSTGDAPARFPVATDSAFWIRLQARNESELPVDWVLEFEHSALYDLQLFADGEPVFAGGDMLPFDRRGLPHRLPAVPLRTRPGDTTIFIRIVSPSPQTVPLRAYTPTAFERDAAGRLIWIGLFYGALAIMVVFNLLLFWSMGDREYAYLSAFIGFVLLGYMKIDGIAFQYLWPRWPLLNYSYNLIFCGAAISILFFFGRFLRTRTRAPLVHRAGQVLLGWFGLVILTFPLQILFDSLRVTIAMYGLMGSAVCLSIASFFVGVYVWRRGNPAGLYITLAVATSTFIGNLWYLEWIGLISNFGVLTAVGGHVGFIAYVALLGFGTGQRIRSEIKSLQRLNAKLESLPVAPPLPGTAPAPQATPPLAREPESDSGADWTITPRTEEKLKLAIEYLRPRFRENVSREELAARVELNPDNLGRFFKMYTGEKLGDYVNRLRVEEAARMLSESDRKIIDVAFAAGFESLKTFNRNFAAIMNTTPSRYRQRQARNSSTVAGGVNE